MKVFPPITIHDIQLFLLNLLLHPLVFQM